MKKTLIAGIAALSLAAAPAPAQSFDEEDFGKFLFGVVAAIALGAALNKDRDETPATVAPAPPAPPVVRHQPRHDAPRINPGLGHGYAPPVVQPPRAPRIGAAQRVLPGQCFRRFETRYGTQTLFARRCLERHYHFAHALPAQCSVRYVTPQGAKNGFDPLCLRQNGFRSTRGH